MACPNESTWSMYVDGELSPDETRRLTFHRDACPRCRDLAGALAEETHLLVHWLQDVDLHASAEEPITRPTRARGSVLRLAAGVLAAATFIRVGLDLLYGIQAPPVLQWLDPRTLSGQMNLFVNAIVYAVNEGGPTMASLVRNTSFAALSILCVSALGRMFTRSVRSSALLMILVLSLLASPSHAIDIRHGDDNVTVAAEETVDDTLLFFGESITVDGTVTGDLIAFGRQITVRGMVQGSVFSFAQRVEVTGRVGGNVLGFAQNVRLEGETAGNLYAAAQSVTVGDDAGVVGNAIIGAQDGIINGSVGRDLTVGAGSLSITGAVGRNILFGGETLTVLAPARIEGELEAHLVEKDNLRIDPGATILGPTTLELREVEPNQFWTLGFYVGWLIRLAGAFLAGFVLFWIFPPAREVSLDDGRALLSAGGIGFLAAVATPVAAILVGITLIGLPVALTALAAWILGLYLGKVVIAQLIGRALLGSGSIAASGVAGPLLAGLVLVFVATSLPYVGGVVNVLLTLLGFGALLGIAYRTWKARPEPQSPTV